MLYSRGTSPIHVSKLLIILFFIHNLVKTEVKLEDCMNGMEIKAEPGIPVLQEYPENLEDFFRRTNAQMFMLQVSFGVYTCGRLA